MEFKVVTECLKYIQFCGGRACFLGISKYQVKASYTKYEFNNDKWTGREPHACQIFSKIQLFCRTNHSTEIQLLRLLDKPYPFTGLIQGRI